MAKPGAVGAEHGAAAGDVGEADEGHVPAEALGVIDHVEGVAEADVHEQLAALFDADVVVVAPGSTHGFPSRSPWGRGR